MNRTIRSTRGCGSDVGVQTVQRGTLALGIALIAMGCGSSVNEPEVDPCGEVFIRLESGDDQLARPGDPVPSPVEVRLVDGAGAPIGQAGCNVSWSVLEGGGSVAPSAPATASDGTATATWTLGSQEGVQSLRATLDRGLSAVALAVALEESRDIVYISDASGSDVGGDSGRLALINADGSNPVQLTTGFYADESPAWSPDGMKIAFVRRFHESCSTEQGDLMVLDLMALTLRRLTDDGACAEASAVSWNPDGTSVVMDRDGDLVEVDVGTGSASVFIATSAREFRPAWSSSGIAYSLREDVGQPTKLMFRASPGDAPVELQSGGSDFNPVSWSPDGSQVVVFTKTPAQSLNWSLWLHDIDSGDFSQIPGSERGWEAAFAPDGASVVASLRGSLAGGPCSGVGDDYLVIIDVATGDQTELTTACDTPSRSPDWRPTG